ncbi:MAG: leucyl/phenylalanyl-tRNA--protein transferase [Leadbetterella sp.]|nr:leucyl/phenylalanyl-tRNA--protein transferase [Leadbetterella sp.]
MGDFSAGMVLSGYLQGVFPMAEPDGAIYWYAPDPRCIIPLEAYCPARSLRPVINRNAFEIKINTAFEAVIRHCAVPRSEDDGIWISEEIMAVYTELHHLGYAHSVEAWQNGELAGGLYGVSLGKVFFGESMFHRVPNASKVAFHFLVERLRERKFGLLDSQFINDNVKRFGAKEISKQEFLAILSKNVSLEKHFI